MIKVLIPLGIVLAIVLFIIVFCCMIYRVADAVAEKIRKEGIAEAEVIRQKGLAEADVEKQKLMAQAEGERALADARASNEKVNFEIEKLKIENEAKITIATKTAEIMAKIGENAEFINIGGSAQGQSSGNVLIDTMASIPSLMKTLNVQNEALNGKSFNDELNQLVASVAELIKGVLATTEVVDPADAIPEKITSKAKVKKVLNEEISE